MANIPGISGYVQPGVFARDRVISRGVSIPGGLRIPCIMGEGLREETIVEAAAGNGLDGNPDCSPTGDPAGRFFSLRFAPVVSGRTELFLNGSPLRGVEEAIDENPFDGAFDFRLDTETGCIELQGASIGDQDGKGWSASSLNKGNGVVVEGECGGINILSVLDPNAPPERWTIKAVGVIRDGSGNIIPGQSTFTVTGSVSGQIKDQFGQPIVFHDTYYTNTTGATSGNDEPCLDGYVVADSVDFADGEPVLDPEDLTTSTTNKFKFVGNLISAGQALVGDYLCLDDGYSSYKITAIEYSTSLNETTLTVDSDSIDSSIGTVPWKIKAIDLFIDTAVTGVFSSSTIGKVLAICSGPAAGLYKIEKVTSSKRLRVSKLSDPTVGYPTLNDIGFTGLSSTGAEFHILETNGIILLGIKYGTKAFEVGDKFFVDVNSKVLNKNDRLEAKYIAVSDINDPELFLSAADLSTKHGQESLTNTLSLGSKLCFENQAPFVLAVQCKPPVPRRTTVVLVDEANANGVGGITPCNGDCEADDLTFPIPLPSSGLQKARPDSDTQVNIFIIRDGQSTQIFPNKVGFYDPALEDPSGQFNFINNSYYDYSYTIIRTDTKVTGQGNFGTVDGSVFSTPEINFDAEDVGKVIVVQTLKDSLGNFKNTASEIATVLFGSGTEIELVIEEVINDSSVIVKGATGLTSLLSSAEASEIQFYIKDVSVTTDSKKRAALLLNKSVVNASMKAGDGLKISYIDEVDAEFFDTNWFEAFEALEAEECQIVVPLPLQNRSGIFRAAVQHVETMSTITIQKERVAMFGAQQGVTPDALIGLEEVAVEDIGVLEGIQGDDPEEILGGNTEDLQNYKLSDNFTSNRSVYFYPDQVVRSINGTNTFIDGFYMAAAAAGYLSATQNVAIPLTNKVLSGFNILRNKKFRPVTLNQLGAVGATVLQPVVGGGKVLAGRTTSQSGYVEDEEISIIFIRDRVKEVLRQGLQAFVGVVEDNNTQGSMTSRVVGLLASLLSQGLITGYKNVRVERDKLDPRQWNVYLQFQPAYPINYVFIDIEVGIL